MLYMSLLQYEYVIVSDGQNNEGVEKFEFTKGTSEDSSLVTEQLSDMLYI